MPRPDVRARRRLVLGIAVISLAGFAARRERVPLFPAQWSRVDFAQDYIGARALVSQDELYPVLGPAHRKIGLDFEVDHRSTHPPTAFLFALPLAGLTYPVALRLWALAMGLCLLVAARAFGLSWRWAVPATLLALSWPPATRSTGQLTPIWLVGIALGYRSRHRPAISGAWLALASLPKFLAAPALIVHLRGRHWSAVAGFALVWALALAGLLICRADALTAYWSANRVTVASQIERADNGALLVQAVRVAGPLGAAAAGALILLVTWLAWRGEHGEGWACGTWLGVALLPIAWVYSLLPLLPWMVRLVVSGSPPACGLGVVALLLPLLGPRPGLHPLTVALSILAAGVGHVIMAHNAMVEARAPGLTPAAGRGGGGRQA